MDFFTTIDQDQLLDPSTDFEPISRPRSNTWPLPRPEPGPSSEYTPPPTLPEEDLESTDCLPPSSTGSAQQQQQLKKSTSRRNAWGNLSYADLITQAIQSSPESRLTLSQIYDWMVTNVPYFKDKGDSNSSAGWKNSIRHNLSLHNRFMRVQNEGTGKSSWWMLNPDAKPGKAARRRATTLETSKYEKKRGRIKKKLEQMRNGGLSPSGASLGEGLELYGGEEEGHLHPPPHFSPQSSDSFRPRTSSNASSIGPSSRLSPLLDDQLQFYSGYFAPDRFGAEALAASLGPAMRLGQESPHAGPSFEFQGGQGPFRSHSFGVSSHYTRPQLSAGGSMTAGQAQEQGRQQQPHPHTQPHPHSSSLDHLHLFPTSGMFNPFQQSQQQQLFSDIKPDLDFNLEQLEPSFTTQVDEEVLQSELLSSELLQGFGEYIGEGTGQQFGQLQPQTNTITQQQLTGNYNPQQPTLLEQTPPPPQQQGRQWVH